MPKLYTLIQKLKGKDDVDAVFIIGSHGRGEQKPYSDLDLVVILKENIHHLKSVYRGVFLCIPSLTYSSLLLPLFMALFLDE